MAITSFDQVRDLVAAMFLNTIAVFSPDNSGLFLIVRKCYMFIYISIVLISEIRGGETSLKIKLCLVIFTV